MPRKQLKIKQLKNYKRRKIKRRHRLRPTKQFRKSQKRIRAFQLSRRKRRLANTLQKKVKRAKVNSLARFQTEWMLVQSLQLLSKQNLLLIELNQKERVIRFQICSRILRKVIRLTQVQLASSSPFSITLLMKLTK